jgi:methionine-rich copper-binding protein CopC
MNARALLVSLTIASLATPATAHAFLQHESPGAGETLASAPKEIVLDFTEPLEPAFSGVGVTDAAGHNVEAAHSVANGASMRVSLKVLATGVYRVSWHAVSVDNHRTEGAYSFTIKP